MKRKTRIILTGAGGFIGHHCVTSLKKQGYWVCGADKKYQEFRQTDADEFELLDLRLWENCLQVTKGIDEEYALAVEIGGMGFISSNHSQILHNKHRINFHSLDAAYKNEDKRYFFTSSACVYPEYLQNETDVSPLREEQAYPAQPQDAYGWEKFINAHLCTHYRKDLGIETRIVRFHNIIGPYGTWCDGREKTPAALGRKVAISKLSGDHEIEIWGDGEQTRSFCYIDDCVTGIQKLMRSEYGESLNLGQDRLISINQLADFIANIVGIEINKKYIPGPQGVH